MVTTASRFCDTCGAANQARASYCHTCGRPLQGTQPSVYNSATGRLLANVLLHQRYRILAPTGKGGMGAVYKAEDTHLGNRLVAIKEMSQSGLSPQEVKEATAAFKQEALLLAGLQHPNLPSIFEHFEENGRCYLVMSFIEGQTLADYLSQTTGGKLALDEVLHIGLQLCEVLAYLHGQASPIIFRDLKPSNIMRTASGHLYLIDFGIARHFKPGQAKDTVYYGSMGYAPPEQYGRAQTTPRSDIYSLGATLYQLVSGHDPASSPFRFPPLPSLMPTAPGALTTLMMQMVELDEDKRPANMLVVKHQLQALVAPPVAPPPPPIAPTVAAPSPNPPAPVAPPPPARATPAPTPVLPLAPTQVATPSPSSGKGATLQTRDKKVKVWRIGKRQIIAALLGAVLCGALSPVFLPISLSYVLVPALIVLVFFGVEFGPWVGLFAGAVGCFLYYAFSVHDYFYFWQDALGYALTGFIAGLAPLLSWGKGNMMRIVIATAMGALGIIVGVFALIVVGIPVIYLIDLALTNVFFCLVLLPILLLVYNAILGG